MPQLLSKQWQGFWKSLRQIVFTIDQEPSLRPTESHSDWFMVLQTFLKPFRRNVPRYSLYCSHFINRERGISAFIQISHYEVDKPCWRSYQYSLFAMDSFSRKCSSRTTNNHSIEYRGLMWCIEVKLCIILHLTNQKTFLNTNYLNLS